MNALVGPLLNTLLSMSIGACIRLYPIRDKLRISIKSVMAIYAFVFLVDCAVFIFFRDYFAANYVGNQFFKIVSGALTILTPLIITKSSIFQHLFLFTVIAHYILVVFGTGNIIELNWGGDFAARFPYLICDGVIILLTIPLLPLTLKGLDRIFKLLPDSRALVWKYIWIIPLTFAALCLMASNVFTGGHVIRLTFIIVRIAISVCMALTCLLLARTLQQEADSARHEENARMMEIQLDLQREQYIRFTKSAETEKAVIHDARHHLAAMMDLNQAGEREKLGAYLADLAGAVPSQNEERYCDNFAVNAVAAHYLGQARREGVRVDTRLSVPEDTGRVSAMDLCVIVGNLLENAVEACRHVKTEDKHIRINSRADVHGIDLSIVVENSFDGEWRVEKGVYISRKESAEVSGDQAYREGVGLSSVKAICKKHGGLAEVKVTGSVWKVSALVEMRDESMITA